jgi:hypothetical protein
MKENRPVIDYLADEFKYLESVDVAPATPEADSIRAAVERELAPQKCYWRADALINAEIMDEQYLLARLRVAFYKDWSECLDELLMTIIVQRAIAELKYRIGERYRSQTGHEGALLAFLWSQIDQEEALLALLQSRLSGDRFGGISEELRDKILGAALQLTKNRIKRCEEQLWLVMEFSFDEIKHSATTAASKS